jgi:hypothetical protein
MISVSQKMKLNSEDNYKKKPYFTQLKFNEFNRHVQFKATFVQKYTITINFSNALEQKLRINNSPDGATEGRNRDFFNFPL